MKDSLWERLRNMVLDSKRIKKEMHELEEKLLFQFKDLSWLVKAMNSQRLGKKETEGKNHKDYSNEALATVGDAVLKLAIADLLYLPEKGVRKSDITIIKGSLERNEVLYNVLISEKIDDYAFKEDHFRKDEKVTTAFDDNKVPCGKHDTYIEAIVGAIYYDSGFEKAKQWIIDWLLPRLELKKVV